MGTYFIRRMLLMVPTFIGCTLLVFIILQVTPGGPLEQAVQRLQMGASQEGGESGGGSVSDIMSGGSQILPEKALNDLKRFYGFDKPIWMRYLIWLGIWEREIKHRDFIFESDQSEIKKRVGKKNRKRIYVTVKKENDKLFVFDDDGIKSSKWFGKIEKLDDGKTEGVIFQTEHSGILTGNLGKSYTYQEQVTEVMKPRFKISIFFGLIGMTLSYLVCVPLGIRKALNHGSVFDFVSSVMIFVAYSIPGWAFGGVLLVLLGGGSFWDVFPLGGFRSPTEVWVTLSLWGKILDQLHHAILPIFAYSIGSFTTLTVLMKNGLLEQLSQDYIRTAFAKGISEKRAVWVHAIRNSLIPIAAGIGHILGIVISGSYIIEKVFNIDGFGKLSFQAILDRDYPIVLSFLVITVMLKLIGNLISDLILASVDPRIRFK
jgi:microcin C transport system permease protein